MKNGPDAAFLKRVATYMAVVVALGALPLGLLAPTGLLDWSKFLAEIPVSLGACFALSWAIAYRREYRFPKAKRLLKTGAVWTAIWMPCAMLFALFVQASDMSSGTIFVVVPLFGTFGVLAGFLIFGFWLFLVHRYWRESWSLEPPPKN